MLPTSRPDVTLAAAMGIVRPFREDDVDGIARLHQEVFPPDSGPAPLGSYRVYLRETFLTGPRPESGFPSLVCEEPDGELGGFLGVVPVRMAQGDRALWATVCTQFCVDPRRRGMTGLKLIRHHFAGPQDLSITDGANAVTRRLWCWAGGETVTSFSLHFVRPLRPARYALSLAARRPAFGRLARRMSASARLIDFALARAFERQVRPQRPPTRAQPLDPETMIAALPEVARERPLRPLYEPEALAWILERTRTGPEGDMACVLVRDESDQILGWYIYHRERTGLAQLLQLAAPADAAGRVLDHLLHDAWRAGMSALTGRLDPALAQAYSDRYSLFSRRGPWTLVHAHDPAVSRSFHCGDAFFSRLDGEWCARFRPPAG